MIFQLLCYEQNLPSDDPFYTTVRCNINVEGTLKSIEKKLDNNNKIRKILHLYIIHFKLLPKSEHVELRNYTQQGKQPEPMNTAEKMFYTHLQCFVTTAIKTDCHFLVRKK